MDNENIEHIEKLFQDVEVLGLELNLAVQDYQDLDLKTTNGNIILEKHKNINELSTAYHDKLKTISMLCGFELPVIQ